MAALLLAVPADATRYFVRASGDDAASGRNPSKAFRTIARAAEKAGGGDTVIVGPGTYEEGNITPRGNGRRRELVRFVADPSGGRTGDPPGMVLVDASGHSTAFRMSSRPWVVINGFGVANAREEGISVKSGSDRSVVANCIVFSNGGRGIWVRDSTHVIVFNNLVYANGGTGIDFGGDQRGASDGAAVNNTVYANGLDGIRIEGVVPAPRVSVLQNVIAQNFAAGINLKERSAAGYVAQWNLNIDGYGSVAERSALDVDDTPLLVGPSGRDQVLGMPGYLDDDFRLRQVAVGQGEDSAAVDASPFSARRLRLRGSTQSGGAPDSGRADLGFHYGNSRELPRSRLKQLRRRASTCQRLTSSTAGGVLRCVSRGRSLRRLGRRCGAIAEEICSLPRSQ